MRIVIAGAHGKIARQLGPELVGRGDSVLGLVRNQDHADELGADGIEPAIVDLEAAEPGELVGLLTGADAVVFAAGAGPGSGAPRKDTVDRGGSVLLAEAAERAGVRRFVQISAMGTTRPNPPDVGEVFGAYLDAKRAAEADLRQRDLDWTILRPGRLTDDAATGRVRLEVSVERGEVTRADVASVVVALLDQPRTSHRALEVVGGDVPIDEAVRATLS